MRELMDENLDDPTYVGIGMYRENIMDHFSNPRNNGTLNNPDVVFQDHNPLCGDIIVWNITLENDKISQVKFSGKGCAISQASTSMLTEILTGKNLTEILNIKNQDVFDLLGIELSATRVKCALLGLKALQKALLMYEARGVKVE